MRISDWSSDVCSSDLCVTAAQAYALCGRPGGAGGGSPLRFGSAARQPTVQLVPALAQPLLVLLVVRHLPFNQRPEPRRVVHVHEMAKLVHGNVAKNREIGRAHV